MTDGRPLDRSRWHAERAFLGRGAAHLHFNQHGHCAASTYQCIRAQTTLCKVVPSDLRHEFDVRNVSEDEPHLRGRFIREQ